MPLKKSLEAGVPHPGLPAPLPHGERVVWQGLPRWHSLARQIFHTHLIGAYFVLLAVWRVAVGVHDGRGAGDIALAVALVVGTGVMVIGLLELLAWFGARATIYTITNRRIVMRVGAAFTKTIDIPFKAIESVDLKANSNGVGNISIKLNGNSARIPYFLLWPHARPWQWRLPQPMLRALPEVRDVGGVLASHLESALREEACAGDPALLAESGPEESPPEPAPSPGSSSSSRRVLDQHSRVPVFGAAALVILSLVAVGWAQISESMWGQTVTRSPRTVYDIKFSDIGADRLAVVDVRRDETIAIVEPGRDGLIRGALRGLKRARDVRGLPVDEPYQLVIWDTGRMTLSDLETDRHIPLDSFGPAQTGVLAKLLQLRTSES